MSTDQQVQEALQNLASARDIQVLLRPCDTEEEEMVPQFASAGCGCSKKCSSQFSVDYVRDIRAQCYDLTHSELDMVLLGQLMASTNTSEKVVVESGHLEAERKRAYTTFYHAGKVVCGKTFRIHGNTHKRPKHSLSFESTEFVIRFLLSYAEQNALLLPGRVPGYSRTDIKLLPSSVSKRGIWKTYHSAAEEEEAIHAVAYSTFCQLWRSLLPSVIIMKPMTDLCWTCHQNSTAILRAVNCSEENKSSTIKAAEEHLRIVQVERSFYKSTCDACRESVRALLQLMENSNHHLSRVTLLQTRTTSKSTTLLTTLNRFSLPLIPFSQDRSTFLSQGSLRCSVSIMRPCHMECQMRQNYRIASVK